MIALQWIHDGPSGWMWKVVRDGSSGAGYADTEADALDAAYQWYCRQIT